MKKNIDNEAYFQDLENAFSSSIGISKLRGKKILVTGASGLIGSFIIDLFLYLNYNHDYNITIYALGRNKKHLEEIFSYARENIVFVEKDVSAPWSLFFKVDYIIHAAGYGHPAAFVDNPVGTMVTHFTGTQNMLDYAKAFEAESILYLSTGEVYGQMPKGAVAFTENDNGYLDLMNPRSCYPCSKRAAETLCASYAKQFDIPVKVARLSHVYGASVNDNDNRATAQFLRQVLKGEDIILNSPGTQLRSYTYIADCASALLTVLINGISGEAVNIANSKSRITIAGFAKILAENTGCKVIFSNPDDREKSMQSPISYQVLDSGKLEQMGWRGRYDIEDGIRQMVEVSKGR